MNYNLVFLRKEADMSKVLARVTQKKEEKTYKNDSFFLFVSLWDKWCNSLVEKLKEGSCDEDVGKTVYIINSFDMPHAFLIFGTKITPSLVKVLSKKVVTLDRLPSIYAELKL
jgi:hypothetical protein